MTPQYSKHDEAHANRVFYGAGLVTSLTGVAAISAAVQSAWFFLVASALVALGYYISIRLRADGKNLRIVETIVIGICLATYARLFAAGDASPLLSPGLAMTHKELSLAVMLVWAEVVRSFSLVSDESLLFASVPSLALIGVVATTSPGGDTLVYFSLWLCASITMFIEGGKSIAERGRASSSTKAVSMGAILGVGSVLTGIIAGPFLKQASVSAFMNLAPEVYANRRGNELYGESETNTLEIAEGPVRLSSRPVLRVEAPSDLPANAYWRCRVWIDYTGRYWKSESKAEPAQLQSNTARKRVFASQNSAPDSNVSATREIVQHITLESTSDAYLPTLSEPVRFEMPTGLSAPQSDDTNCWQIPRVPSVTTRTYTVVSEVPDPTSEQLRKASQDYSDISRISPPCVEQPIVSERVIAKALEETRRYKNPYDKVTALHRYLARTCVYDLQTPPIPASKSDDPVDYFLWTSRRGYCDLFATALATMTRSLGIPARVATGYIQGEYDLAERKWVVRDKDRHMWAEVYFPGYGWIPFEATPSSGAEEQGYWQAVWTELKLAFAKGNPRILFLLAALMLGIFSLRYVILSDAGKLHNTIIVHEREELKRARHIWKKLAKMLRAHGVAAPPSATPIELSDVAALVLADAPAARHAVHRAALLISEILYSGDDPGESIEKLESAARVARIELKHAKPRIRFLITDRREN